MFDGSFSAVFTDLLKKFSFSAVEANFRHSFKYLSITISVSKNFLAQSVQDSDPS